MLKEDSKSVTLVGNEFNTARIAPMSSSSWIITVESAFFPLYMQRREGCGMLKGVGWIRKTEKRMEKMRQRGSQCSKNTERWTRESWTKQKQQLGLSLTVPSPSPTLASSQSLSCLSFALMLLLFECEVRLCFGRMFLENLSVQLTQNTPDTVFTIVQKHPVCSWLYFSEVAYFVHNTTMT